MTGDRDADPEDQADPFASERSLLRMLSKAPLDADYLPAEEFEHPEEHPPDTPATKALTAAGAVVLGALLIVSVVTLRQPVAEDANPRAYLLQETEERLEEVGTLSTGVADREQEVRHLQESALARGDDGEVERLAALNTALGATALTGPGLELVLDDSTRTATVPGNPSSGEASRVKDTDLQIVVNGLWDAGAEAIAINGQRVTGATAIRSGGEAVLVDFRPLSPPYTVAAIGPERLETDFATTSASRYLQMLTSSYGIRVERRSADSLTVPAHPPATLREARPMSTDPDSVSNDP